MNEKLKKYIENKKYDLALQFIHKIQKKEYSLEYHNYKIVVFLLSQKYDAALAELTVLVSKFPHDPSLLCNIGLAYKGKRNFDNAIKYLSKSLQIDPENLNISLNLIETHIEVLNFTKAIELLNKIIQKNLRMERCYQLLAYCYREINLFEESHKNLELAIKINPYNYENFYHFGFSFIWKKDYNNAIICFKKSFELNNKFISSLYQLNNLLKYKVDSAEHNFLIELNEKELDTNNLSWKYLTLSEIYYNDNDINSFFQNLHKANQLKNKLIAYRAYDQESIKKNYKNLPNFNFESYPSIPIFIVGMPRSGSSLIEQVLSQSDEIYAAGEIPILHEYFKNNIFIENKNLNEDNLISIRNTYINFISSLPKKKYFIDKLPLNFLWIGYIKSIFPEAIFIHTHRNKLDIFMSLYKTFFADGALEFSYSQDNIVNFYKLYKNIIQFWSEENIDIIDIKYENIIDSPTHQFTKLFESLDLCFNKSYLELENIDRPVKTASFLQISKKLQKINYPDWSLFKHEIPIFFKD